MRDRFTYAYHPQFWNLGFVIEPDAYLYLYVGPLSFSIHLGRPHAR